MGDFCDVVETKSGRPPFDGMCGTKNGIQIFAIGFSNIKIQQQLLHFGEQFICLVEKYLVELAHIYRHF